MYSASCRNNLDTKGLSQSVQSKIVKDGELDFPIHTVKEQIINYEIFYLFDDNFVNLAGVNYILVKIAIPFVSTNKIVFY